MSALSAALSAAVGCAVGVLTGFGVGGGTILMLYLTTIGGIEAASARGINLLYFFPCSICALVAHFKNGFVERSLLLPAIIPGVVFAAGAAWLSTLIDGGAFTKLFGVFLLIVGVKELFGKSKK